MGTLENELLTILGRGSIAMLLAMLLVRMLQPQSLTLRRAACVAVLSQGWLVAPLTIEIPWYKSQPVFAAAASPVASSVDPSDVHKSPSPSLEVGISTSQARTGIRPTTSPIGRVLLVVWFVGCLAVMMIIATQYARLIRSSRTWQVAPETWQRPWANLASPHSANRRVPMFVSRKEGPMICRLPRQTCLVVPRDFWESCTESERLAVLRHEWSHHRHHDLSKSFIAGVLAFPYWFHPAAWWSVSAFNEAAELRCDVDAAPSYADRCSFLRALDKLVHLQQTTFSVGHSAHAHPLLLRMRRLVEGPISQESKMSKCFYVMLLTLGLVTQSVRIELIAQEAPPPLSVDALQSRMAGLDAKLESLIDLEESLKSHAEELKDSVGSKAEELEELRNSPERISENAHQRVKQFLEGTEEAQLESLKDIEAHQPRDEAVLFCGHVAKTSGFESVRREALRAACSFGKEGYPAIAIAYEELPEDERLYLVDLIKEFDEKDQTVLMAMMAKDADTEMLTKLVEQPIGGDVRFVLLGGLADALGEQAITKILRVAEKTEGEQGLIMLYAVAKSEEPKYILTALKAARKRGPVAYPVIAAAGSCEDPSVRAEIVRAAKAWGGEVGEVIIQRAKVDSDPVLREAAINALAETK